ncbi:MAG TPA: trehalose-phosphatase [Baekduia sp.]|nr:trehalose-phosphatase [Baekduia sp.]
MPAAPTIDELLAPLIAAPSRSAVLLDVDGTLAPIVRQADDAHVPQLTREPLKLIAREYGLVACVSGRRAAVARRIVSLGTMAYVGNHGAELLPAGTAEPVVVPEAARYRAQVQKFAKAVLQGELAPRVRIRGEDKSAIYAFHWRGAPDEQAALDAARQIAAAAESEGLWVHWGRKVLEVRPPVPLTKGTGVSDLLAGAPGIDNANGTLLLTEASPKKRASLHLVRGAAALAAHHAGGIEPLECDLDAFAALRELQTGGSLTHVACVGVRSEETPVELAEAADLLVDGPLGVRALLQALAGS